MVTIEKIPAPYPDRDAYVVMVDGEDLGCAEYMHPVKLTEEEILAEITDEVKRGIWN